MTTEKKLTFIEASSIITGYGVGGGIMAVPFLAAQNGLLTTLLILAVAYLFSVLLHLMIAEMCSGDGEANQVVELFRKYLFKGPYENLLAWLFFALLLVILFSSMAAYIVGAAEILFSDSYHSCLYLNSCWIICCYLKTVIILGKGRKDVDHPTRKFERIRITGELL